MQILVVVTLVILSHLLLGSLVVGSLYCALGRRAPRRPRAAAGGKTKKTGRAKAGKAA